MEGRGRRMQGPGDQVRAQSLKVWGWERATDASPRPLGGPKVPTWSLVIPTNPPGPAHHSSLQ